jgi:hypothetical protein
VLRSGPRANTGLRAALTDPVVVAMLDDATSADVSAADDYIGDVCTPLDNSAAVPTLG